MTLVKHWKRIEDRKHWGPSVFVKLVANIRTHTIVEGYRNSANGVHFPATLKLCDFFKSNPGSYVDLEGHASCRDCKTALASYRMRKLILP